MKSIEVLSKVAELESSSIFNCLANRHIGVHYPASSEMFESGQMALMIGCDKKHIGIFLNPESERKYQIFYLWHELGHFETEDEWQGQRNYMFTSRRSECEYTANLFAIFALLPMTCPEGENMISMAHKVGIPVEIVKEVLFKLRFDPHPIMRVYYSDYM